MSIRDASRTRARILASATAEFSAYGLAGGRVDRIARAAATNVRMIYAYFGNKTGLFDATLSSALGGLATALPPRPDDLGAWAGDLFDHHTADPSALRLALWAQLERPDTAGEPPAGYLAKVDAVAEGTRLPRAAALDLLVLIYGIAQSWGLSPSALREVGGQGGTSRHRAALVAAVDALVADARL